MPLLAVPIGLTRENEYAELFAKDFYAVFKEMFWKKVGKVKFYYIPVSKGSPYNITFKEYKAIWKTFVEMLIPKMLYEGRPYYFPYTSGRIEFHRRKNFIYKAKKDENGVYQTLHYKSGRPIVHSAIDFALSKKYKKTIYYTNEHTQGDYFMLKYKMPTYAVKKPFFKYLRFEKLWGFKKLIGTTIQKNPGKINVFNP